MGAEESQKEIQAISELILGLRGRERSRRSVTTRASSDFEAGRGPVLGRATAQEGEG